MAIKEEVPTNACTFLLARSRKLIKHNGRFSFLVTFADTFKEHTGAIYRADNWTYLGLTKPTPVWVNENGQIMGKKRASENLTDEEMVALGFRFMGKFAKHKFKYIL